VSTVFGHATGLWGQEFLKGEKEMEKEEDSIVQEEVEYGKCLSFAWSTYESRA
jgi:hypothetical protein